MGSWRRDVRRWFLPAIGVVLIVFTPPATQTLLEKVGLWIWFAWAILGIALAVGVFWAAEFVRARRRARVWPGWSEIRSSNKGHRVCVGADGFPVLRDPGTAPKRRGSIAVDPAATVAVSLVDGQLRTSWLARNEGHLWGPFPAAFEGPLLAVTPDRRNSSIRMVMNTSSTPYEVCANQESVLPDTRSELDDHSGPAVAAGYLNDSVIWADERGQLWCRAGNATPQMQNDVAKVFKAISARIAAVRDLDVARYGTEYLVIAAGESSAPSVERRWLGRSHGTTPIVIVFVDHLTFRPTRYAELSVKSEDDVGVRVEAVRHSGEPGSPPEVITSMGGTEVRHSLRAEDIRTIPGVEAD